MTRGFLAIDANNWGFACTSRPALTVGDLQVQGVYHFLRSLKAAVTMFPTMKPLILWDGVSWRYDAFAEYKVRRDAEPKTAHEKKMQDLRAQWRKQKVILTKGLESLGVSQMSADNYEADDLAGLLVKKYRGTDKKILLVSGDHDWIQLVGPGVGWFDTINNERVTASNLTEKLGVPSARAYLEMKCLKGDTSDDIPGVGGIGEKGAQQFVNTYPSVPHFANGVLDGSISKTGVPEKFLALATDETKLEAYRRNLVLMDLQGAHVPRPIDLKVNAGEFDLERFKKFCSTLNFSSILSEIDTWAEKFDARRAMLRSAA